MTRYTYPHTIENGAGERLTFRRRVMGVTEERVEGDNVVSPGAGPPMHVHYYSEEGFTVTAGRLGYQRLGEPAQYAGPGESVVFKPGEPHRFWNAGEDELRCTAYVEPADNVEFFLTEIFEATERRGGKGPDLFTSAFLLRRYRSEFRLLDIPRVVQLFVFPAVVALGAILGRYRRFADAPEPVRR